MAEYVEHWEDGVLRMKTKVVKPIVVGYDCPSDIDEDDFRGLHPAAQALLSMCGRKKFSFWEK